MDTCKNHSFLNEAFIPKIKQMILDYVNLESCICLFKVKPRSFLQCKRCCCYRCSLCSNHVNKFHQDSYIKCNGCSRIVCTSCKIKCSRPNCKTYECKKCIEESYIYSDHVKMCKKCRHEEFYNRRERRNKTISMLDAKY